MGENTHTCLSFPCPSPIRPGAPCTYCENPDRSEDNSGRHGRPPHMKGTRPGSRPAAPYLLRRHRKNSSSSPPRGVLWHPAPRRRPAPPANVRQSISRLTFFGPIGKAVALCHATGPFRTGGVATAPLHIPTPSHLNFIDYIELVLISPAFCAILPYVISP
jgi:hypothetical protein